MASLVRSILGIFGPRQDATQREAAVNGVEHFNFQRDPGVDGRGPDHQENGAQRERHAGIPADHRSTTRGSLTLKTLEQFLAALQRAVELWSAMRRVETEITELRRNIKSSYSVLDPEIVHLERISSKVDPSWQQDMDISKLKVEQISEKLEGGDGLFARLERAERKKFQTMALKERVLRKIFQSSQHYIDESCESGSIRALKVSAPFCKWMVKVRECEALLENLKDQYREALKHYMEFSGTRNAGIGQNGAQRDDDLAQAKERATSDFRRCEVQLDIEKTNQAERERHWVRASLVPVLNRSGLLSTTFVPPDEIVPSARSSVADLSPLKDRHGPGGTRTHEVPLHPRQHEGKKARRDYQHHVEQLRELEAEYRDDCVDLLYAYTEDHKALLEAEVLERYQGPYEDVHARGTRDIEIARQRLEQATARVIAAGLEVPPEPPFEEEKAVVDKPRDRRIRKHMRDVARGKSKVSAPPSPLSLRTSSSVRTGHSNREFKDPYGDWRARMRRELIPKQKAMYPAAHKAYLKSRREMWLARMKFSKRAFALKSPRPVRKIDPWTE